MFSRPLHHADEELSGPETPSRRYREILILTKNCKFGPKPELYQILAFDFFSNLNVFSRPLHHAENEFGGPGTPTSRNRLAFKFAPKHEFNPKPTLNEIFVLDFSAHLELFPRPILHTE